MTFGAAVSHRGLTQFPSPRCLSKSLFKRTLKGALTRRTTISSRSCAKITTRTGCACRGKQCERKKPRNERTEVNPASNTKSAAVLECLMDPSLIDTDMISGSSDGSAGRSLRWELLIRWGVVTGPVGCDRRPLDVSVRRGSDCTGPHPWFIHGAAIFKREREREREEPRARRRDEGHPPKKTFNPTHLSSLAGFYGASSIAIVFSSPWPLQL